MGREAPRKIRGTVRRMDDYIPDTPAQLVARLVSADSVVVIGASDEPKKASGRTLHYLQKYGFMGRIFPVNPNRDTVQGLASYASVADLPEVPELAVIVLPAAAVPDAIREVGAFGVHTAIVFASGFAEVGGEGVQAQAELLAVAREARVRMLGPNCVGTVGAGNALTAAFMTGLDQDRFDLTDDGVAFVTQSGAMGAFLLSMAQSTGLGLGRFVSTGNEADISLPEVIEGFVDDPSTTAVLGYIEGIRDASSFRRALTRARERHVPVGLMKVGRSTRGAVAAQSHTGALVGLDSVYDGLFQQYGVFRAHDVDELLDLGRVFASPKRAAGPRLSIVTLSGGAGVLMTDAAEDVGLEVLPWEPEWSARVAAVLPDFASVTNPIDTTGAIASDQAMLRETSVIALEHPGTDVVAVMIGNLDREEDSVCAMLIEAAKSSVKPLIVIWVGGSGRPVEILSHEGIPTFTEPLRAMRAIAALVKWSGQIGSGRGLTTGEPASVHPMAADVEPLRVLDEVASKELLSAYGVGTVPEVEVDSAEGAVRALHKVGFPAVVKLLSTEVSHKSDHGLVKVGLNSAEEVRSAAEEVLAIAERMGVSDRRIVVQKLVRSETELILGMRRDTVFGPVIALGIGGVLTEIAADVQVRLPPLSEDDVDSMLGGLRARALLEGVRGRTPLDRELLRATVLGFSRLIVERGAEFDSIEINPLLVDESGASVAVDALAFLVPNSGSGVERSCAGA
ncbi:acetate--CoA ligase family protein [soil metagenome]